jgi:hypothetical protein
MEPLIWWTSQWDCEAITSRAGWPKYLREEYESRHGRNGRGRLWVAKRFGTVAVDPWPETPFANRLGEDYAGIVIDPKDAALLRALPGIVTNTALERVAF